MGGFVHRQNPVAATFLPGSGQLCHRGIILGSISRALPRPLDLRQLFKLRLVVAAMGETQQGFPRSAPFALTRAGFRVAQLACDEALAIQPTPGGPVTCHLFRLTPQLEDAFENERNRWMDEPQEWADCFQAAWALSAEQWPQALIDLADLDPTALDWARQQTPQTAKALRLDNPFELNQGHIERLAAGFVCSQPGQLVVPYVQVAG